MGIQPTNAGIDFQQRISAWCMISMLFEISLDNILNADIKQVIEDITFESNDKIDDLVIKTNNNQRIYMQIKRNISLSINKKSEFYGVCQQFVEQYLENNNDDFAYVLVTSSIASSAIRETLRRLLESFRTSKNFDIIKELNKNEKEVLEKVSTVIKAIYIETTGEEISERTLLELFNKIYIDIFDIESGQSYEKIVKIVLYSKISVDVNMFWSSMIKSSLQFAANRQTLNKSYLKEKFESYFKQKEKITSTDNVSDFYLDSIHVKMDYVIALGNLEASGPFYVKDEKILYYLELYRFDENGKKSLKYESPNFLTLSVGYKLEIVNRSATRPGTNRFVSSKEFIEKFGDYNLIRLPCTEGGGNNSLEVMHENLILERFKSKKDLLCSNCGQAIFEEEFIMIEVDNVECSGEVGIVHKECLLPIDRVVGITKMPNIKDYSFLKNFDINLWIKQIRDGQFCFNDLKKVYQPISPIVVETNTNFVLGNYCVKILLEDGNFHFATRRGNIDRYNKEGAEKFVKLLKESFIKAKEENNPMCYSSKTFSMSEYNNLIKILGGTEEYIECQKAEIIKFNESIAKLYNRCKNFYAPLIYLVSDEKLLVVNNMLPLFTNPLDIQSYIENWKKTGIEIHDFQINIIRDDNEFCLKIISLINQQIRPVIDMKFGKKNELIQGYVVHTMDEMILYNRMKSIKSEN